MSVVVQSTRYRALALQVTTHSVGACPTVEAAREQIGLNISRIGKAVAASIAQLTEQHGTPVRLVVLPEYCLTGAPTGGPFVEWRAKAALAMTGPEYQELGHIAAVNGTFLGGNAYEADPNFPELYFQTSFLLDPAGDVVLRYRRLISLYSPSPYDVLPRYLEIYGAESLFPVFRSSIGCIAAIASEEILYAELARCHAMRGAEVLIHSTSEMGSPQATAKDIAKRARAAENLVYVVSANAAGVAGTALPERSTTGMAKIVDFEGRVLAACTSGGDSLAANATIDLSALRHRRRQGGLTNTLVRQPFQAYAESYRQALFHPAGQLTGASSPATEALRARQQATIEYLDRLGLI